MLWLLGIVALGWALAWIFRLPENVAKFLTMLAALVGAYHVARRFVDRDGEG